MTQLRMSGEEVLTEADWLLAGGLLVDEVADQLGRTVVALEMLSRRYGRADLHSVFQRRVRQIRDAA